MIDLIDVSKSYGPGLPAVNHANLHIDKGEFVFVVGNSGSGKTTLIKLLMKELDSTSGQTIVNGERLDINLSRTNSPVENSRESPWPELWSTVRTSFWQMSQQETWTRRLLRKS